MRHEHEIRGYDWVQEAKEIHMQCLAAGWWDPYPNKMDRFETAMMLAISELAEGLEGWRKDLRDDHLPQYMMFEVEIADTIIRLLDSAAAYGVTSMLVQVMAREHVAYEQLKNKAVAEQLLYIARCICAFDPAVAIPTAFAATIHVACIHNIDLIKIISDKRDYNARRKDHQKDERAKKGGKKI